MAKTDVLCPFTHKLCKECALYRGRHYFLCFCKQYRGYIGGAKENTKARIVYPDFEALTKLEEPWDYTDLQPQHNFIGAKIRGN